VLALLNRLFPCCLISVSRNADVTAAIVPLLGPTLEPNTIYDWNYTTVNQTGSNGRAIKMPRGRILGGSSSVSE